MATLVIDRLLETFPPAEISGAIYGAALQRCAEKGVTSGAVFDALNLTNAEARRVDGFVTFNAGDSERLRIPSSPEILMPPHPPASPL